MPLIRTLRASNNGGSSGDSSRRSPERSDWDSISEVVRWEFEVCLKEVFRIYDLEEMIIRMADRTWTVAIDDLHLDAQTFSNFVA
ncbi:hypothetical protein RHGRI_031107 [Rhododendron griersonianum]|uniref:Uncharacterized protein n=1 Tax=Rhododendron griersonianum TaxID=479676 RepID=A0AAV6I6I9_9ERIC|nr:hypothetical protein RHGRI_031107 [Rhododendron griersonianum]